MATIGVFLSILLALYVLRRVYAKNILNDMDVTLTLSDSTVVEGDSLTLTEVLTNNKWLPLPWVAVKFKTSKELLFDSNTVGTDAYYRNDLFSILMHQKISRHLPFVCTKRGFYTIGEVELIAWDILFETKHIQKKPTQVSLTVYPSMLPVNELESLYAHVYGHFSSSVPINPDPFTFAGIREYSAGDSMKAINFKASARGLGLMVNVWEFTNARQMVILLDAKRHGISYNEYPEERIVKIAASVANKMLLSGTPVKLVSNGKSGVSGQKINLGFGHDRVHFTSVMESLAYVDFKNQDILSLSQEIDEIVPARDTEYWILTPYYSKEIQQAYEKLKALGANTVWIMPEPKPSYEEFCDEIIFV